MKASLLLDSASRGNRVVVAGRVGLCLVGEDDRVWVGQLVASGVHRRHRYSTRKIEQEKGAIIYLLPCLFLEVDQRCFLGMLVAQHNVA